MIMYDVTSHDYGRREYVVDSSLTIDYVYTLDNVANSYDAYNDLTNTWHQNRISGFVLNHRKKNQTQSEYVDRG